jgi:hypothetical protein
VTLLPTESVQSRVAEEGFSDLRTYRAFLDAVSAKTPGEPFITRSAKHAAVVVSFLFRRAERTVEILTSHLDREIYGDPDVIMEAQSFLSRSKAAHDDQPNIYILHEDPIRFHDHPLVRAISKIRGWENEIVFREVPSAVSQSYTFHFMLSDQKHFMFRQDRASPEALVQFNEPDFGQQLHRSFRKIWEASAEGKKPDCEF